MPTIIIDLKEFVNIIPTMKQESIILGGEYARYNDVVEYFFNELKKCKANLVFFLKNRICSDVDDSMDRIKRQAEEKKRIYAAYDGIKKNQRIPYSLFDSGRNNKRLLHNLTKLCTKYGKLIVTSKNHNQSIARYAHQNVEKVLSVICNDTTFLILEGKYQYWSMSESVEKTIFELCGTRYCRQELNQKLELNPLQMRLYATITRCRPEILYPFSKNLEPLESKRFLKLAIYAKQQEMIDEKNYNLEKIANEIYGKKLAKEHIEQFEKNWNAQDVNYDSEIELRPIESILTANTDRGYSDVVKFCKQNNYFSYHLLMETQSAAYLFSDLFYLDLRRNDSLIYNKLIFSVLMKLSGILQKDKSSDYRPKTQAIFIKMNNEDSGQAIHHEIVYPNCEFVKIKTFSFNNSFVILMIL